MLKVGDIVTRKSYGGDLYFRITNIDWFGNIELVGLDYRIYADAPMEDLVVIDDFSLYRSRKASLEQIDEKIEEIKNQKLLDKKKIQEKDQSNMYKKVKVLHVDGDREYLKICIKYYEQLGIEVHGEAVGEAEQPGRITELLNKHKPDILVITGHDSFKNTEAYDDIRNYRSSKYFVETVKKAREYQPNMDQLIIFAGACQSYYEAILEAGANYASSPDRVLIHAVDPVMISERIASTSVDDILKVEEALVNTFSGMSGLGGFETRGKMRKGLPKGRQKK